MSLLYSMPIKDAVICEHGDWRVSTDSIWGVVVEVRRPNLSGAWDCWAVDTLGMDGVAA